MARHPHHRISLHPNLSIRENNSCSFDVVVNNLLQTLKSPLWLFLLFVLNATTNHAQADSFNRPNFWQLIETINKPNPRHEASLVNYKDKLYLIGGRRIHPVDVYDPATNRWHSLSKTPIELHHFQAVVVKDAIYLIGAMTGQWPNEQPVERVIIYYPDRDQFEFGHTIPKERRRGGAGAVYFNEKIYLVGGITNGHLDGSQAWFDEYDPKTGEWRQLDDAPHARDHFQSVISNNQLFAIGGRTTSHATNQSIELTVSAVDVYDFKQKAWKTLPKTNELPTPRAGNMAISYNQQIFIGGGESKAQKSAHSEIEIFDLLTKKWRSFPRLVEGRHGTGFAIIDNYLYTASGSGNRGGSPELITLERTCLDRHAKCLTNEAIPRKNVEKTETHGLWETVTLDFAGPETSEMAAENPFTDYRLIVDFLHNDSNYTIRGYYAADGNAAQTGATSGNIWRVKFTPNQLGQWTYKASLLKAKNIVFDDRQKTGQSLPLIESTGQFEVIDSHHEGKDFRAHGRLSSASGYFQFQPSGKFWLKGGTNSPENLLGYADFDGTYRVGDQNRDGEASAGSQLHQYSAHIKDWRLGDPTWKNGKGKGLIGAINYLAKEGINASYFLTLNILGDGKDVWPFVNHQDLSRFDCSKLDQWEIVFSHMQKKGILLHLVTQETENELLLDNGNTGPQRQLYYQELIARFGHHLGLVWNLGEENGPAEFSPNGQNTNQRKAMANFIKSNDPYDHPVVLHTHSSAHHKDEILTPLLGLESLDGLSFQVDERQRVYNELAQWRSRAKAANQDWLITMDEIGMWHTGTLPDSVKSDQPSLRRFALWGSLMAGAAGVEWYFGAKHVHNDLTAEDFRSRKSVWQMTRIAIDFFDQFIPYWRMHSTPELVELDEGFVFSEPGTTYLIYLPNGKSTSLDLSDQQAQFSVNWFDPKLGGELIQSDIQFLSGGGKRYLGLPPGKSNQDWVVLVRILPTN